MKNRTYRFFDNEKLKAIFPIPKGAILREIKKRGRRRASIFGRFEVEIDALAAIPRANRTPGQINALRHLEMLCGSLMSEVVEPADLGIFIVHRAAESYLRDTDGALLVQVEPSLMSQTPQSCEGWDVLVAEVLRRYCAKKAYRLFTENRMEYEVMHEVGRRIWRSDVDLTDLMDDQKAFETIERESNMDLMRYLYKNHGQASIDLFQRRMAMAMANEASGTPPDEAQKNRDEAGPFTPPDYAN